MARKNPPLTIYYAIETLNIDTLDIASGTIHAFKTANDRARYLHAHSTARILLLTNSRVVYHIAHSLIIVHND